jgi:hypothetical protein
MFCEVMRERAGGPRNHGCTGMTELGAGNRRGLRVSH